MQIFLQKILQVLSSRTFLVLTLIWFTIGAVWVAFASLYPMAFDEDFHLGLIKIYSGHLLPYGIEHTRDMAVFGAATGDPSYLFHYLMSFPYRLLDWLGFTQTAIIIALRCINIGLVLGALLLYRKSLRALGLSRAISNGSIAAFTLIPILPVMAGQINYDNLLLLMIALITWLLLTITSAVRATKSLPVKESIIFLGLVLLSMPIKYAFLPIALGLLLWFASLCVYVFRRKKKQLFPKIFHDVSALPIATKVLLGLFIIAGAFFAYDYVDNTVRYGSAIPDCAEVFDEQACLSYGPWGRNYYLKQSLDSNFAPQSLPEYVATAWVPGMVKRLTFAVAGPTNDFQTKDPIPVVWIIGIIFAVLGVLALLLYSRLIFSSHPQFWLITLITGLYVGTLITKLYGSYVTTGEAVAVNGRYLLPLVPFVYGILLYAITFAAKRLHVLPYVALIISLLFIIVFLQGGGIGTYIVQGEPSWFFEGWGRESHKVLQTLSSSLIYR